MEATVAPTARVVGCGLFAGSAPGLVGAPLNPILNDIVKLPIQTKGNTQGEMYQAYYAYSNDLKKQGAQYSIPSTNIYDSGNCGIMVSRYELTGPQPEAGTKIGEVKCTWFVRMFTRRYSLLNSVASQTPESMKKCPGKKALM